MSEHTNYSLFRKKEILVNRPAFLERLSVLLTEGYTFHDGLTLLLPHHTKNYDVLLERLNDDFKEGFGVTHLLGQVGFSPGSLLPVAIAEIDGRLAQALNGMAKRLRKKEEKQKKLKNLLMYPLVLFFFITALLIAFRRLFLPNMEALAISRQSEGGEFISSLPFIVTKIPDLIFGIVMIFACIATVCVIVYKKLRPETKIRVFMSLPIAGPFFSMMKTRDFASEMGSLLQSGLSMQRALDVLIGQRLDVVLGEIAKKVKEQVIFGESFYMAAHLTVGLTKQLSAFAKHGEDSGHLPKELTIYSDHLAETIDEKLTSALALLQPALFSIIAICILAAYLALLLPVYGMMDKF
ncbi:competence type IV pilus assembly protein ComGB [Sporosarcina limicola]|uniref:Competence protein ComGB n=1 Tax=Sporosarcina limicola TaxID=34101 RepID=A0A927R3H0_9BACL|nr:competence type IV pilus assembly protein ComGB [Sporosarcina limicola]MBE1553758.1 competence protein ComGB [Sporosarcina limicola]